jgi:carbamoyltransferase
MIILGVNAFHGDAAAALVRDGVLVAAAEEERFRRIKHWAGFPSQAIAYCLREAGLRLGDVDHVAVNQDGKAQRLRKLRYVLAHPPKFELVRHRLRNRRERREIPALLEAVFRGDRLHGAFHNVEHHLAHMSSAFHVSPFDDAAVVSVDGFGDFASAAWGIGQGTRILIEAANRSLSRSHRRADDPQYLVQ